MLRLYVPLKETRPGHLGVKQHIRPGRNVESLGPLVMGACLFDLGLDKVPAQC